MMSQNNAEAVEAAIADLEGRLCAADLPLVALVRQLAAELDAGGATSRVSASYLTALRTLYKRTGAPAPKPAGASLAKLRAKHGGRLS